MKFERSVSKVHKNLIQTFQKVCKKFIEGSKDIACKRFVRSSQDVCKKLIRSCKKLARGSNEVCTKFVKSF